MTLAVHSPLTPMPSTPGHDPRPIRSPKQRLFLHQPGQRGIARGAGVGDRPARAFCPGPGTLPLLVRLPPRLRVARAHVAHGARKCACRRIGRRAAGLSCRGSRQLTRHRATRPGRRPGRLLRLRLSCSRPRLRIDRNQHQRGRRHAQFGAGAGATRVLSGNRRADAGAGHGRCPGRTYRLDVP